MAGSPPVMAGFRKITVLDAELTASNVLEARALAWLILAMGALPRPESHTVVTA